MKRAFCMVLALVCCLFCAPVLAEDPVVFTEEELSAWVDELLRQSAAAEILNHPVDESAKTEDGYAFLYDFATLYYNQPQLNAQSILQCVSVADESCAPLRGVTIGADGEALMQAFGSHNPYLLGDGAFAALYLKDEMPRAAYWSWAQLDENGNLAGMQCAMHVKVGEDKYTDAGVRFVLEGGTVTEIRAYGLYEYIAEADVHANLEAVRTVENAVARGALAEESAQVHIPANGMGMFSAEDLTVDGVNLTTLQVEDLENKLGQKAHVQTLSDAGEALVTAEWDGAYLSGGAHGWDVMSVLTDRLSGPRGLRVGQPIAEALGLFYADGENREWNGQTLLYGDGINAPYALLDGDCALYTAAMQEGSVTLRLQFADGCLEEWMIYTW